MVGSEPTSKQERIFTTLLRSKRNGEGILRPGTKGSEVYEVISRTIAEAGFNALPHRAGHWIGLDGQEAPFFVPGSHDIVEEGDICALEPGIYDEESGGMRIEDDYIITEDGFKKTSHFAMEL